jgi:hypothetical protein
MSTRVVRLSSRYYHEDGGAQHRVFPYDSYESLTEGPVEGKHGPILLYSLNSKVKSNGAAVVKWAWCFACGDWVQATRRTQHQVMLDYVSRTNVQLRVEGGQRQRILALTQRLEERRGK